MTHYSNQIRIMTQDGKRYLSSRLKEGMAFYLV